MAALRKPIESHEPEVLYLLIPPHVPRRRRVSAAERAALALFTWRERAYHSPAGQAVRAVGLVAGYSLAAAPILFGAYAAKSALGVDLIPGRSLVKELLPDLHVGPAR